MTVRVLVLALVLLALAVTSFGATATTSTRIAGEPGVVLTIDGTSAAVDDLVAGGTRFTGIVACVVSGQTVNLGVRVQKAPNGLFIDVVASDTVTNLDTAFGAMNLATAVPNHPSPTENATDTAALAAAAGD